MADTAVGAAPGRMRRIATEEAFVIPEQVEGYRALGCSGWREPDLDFWRQVDTPGRPSARLLPLLLDVDDVRLADMDAAGIDMQLLLLNTPGVQVFDAGTGTALAARANDRLAETIARHPTRFAGLGAVAPQDPAAAAREIARIMGPLKLNGVVINSHTAGHYLDEQAYWPILEAAEALGAPLYIHPRIPPEAVAAPYRPLGLAAAIFGFMAEAGLHGLRLMASGTLDRFPNLQIVLGHMGEGLPYWIGRLDRGFPALPGGPTGKPQLKASDYLKRNVTITTSGMNDQAALRYCIEVLGPERIMWAVDYPYENNRRAVEAMDTAPISDVDRAAIYHRNAERVFAIKGA